MDWIEKRITRKWKDADYQKYTRKILRYYNLRRLWVYPVLFVRTTYLNIRFPFLRYKKNRIFDTHCWYDCIPCGWRKAFGIQLCKELKAALKRNNFLKEYNITTIKEKCGELEIYDNGAPAEVHDIIAKYEYISYRTCIRCGRRAKYRTRGWEYPYCEDCVKDKEFPEGLDEYYKDFDWYGWKKQE